jgi:hypothetical protein
MTNILALHVNSKWYCCHFMLTARLMVVFKAGIWRSTKTGRKTGCEIRTNFHENLFVSSNVIEEDSFSLSLSHTHTHTQIITRPL